MMTYFNSERSDRELDRELAGYVKLLMEEKIKAGMSPGDARRSALVEVGGVEHVKERVRDVRPGAGVEMLGRDVRHAARSLARNPAFTIVAIVTLALGIGANTAIFSIVNGVMLRPLPYLDASRLVSVVSLVSGVGATVSPADLMDWRRDARSFAGLAGSYSGQTILSGSGDAEQIDQARITANAFDVLGVRPLLGRTFLAGEDVSGAPRVAILSEGFWRRRFNSDSSIVGRSITLDGFPTAVVGVAPTAMQWPEPVDVYLGTRFTERDLMASSRGARWITVVGRLAPGASLEAARSELDAIAGRIALMDPDHNGGVRARITPLLESMTGSVREPLWLLLGAVALVLLIACANVGGLTLGRVAARDAELALRTALGATRERLMRQLLVESLLLALVGGGIGVALALLGVKALIAIAPANLPRLDDVGLDGWVLAFAFVVTTLTGLLFGVAPALKASALDVHKRLRAVGRGSAGRTSAARSRRLLVVAEVTLALVLLAGAGLLLRSLARLRDVDPGFRSDGLATFSLGQLPRSLASKEAEIDFTARLLEGLRRLPGVTAADVSFNLPLNGGSTQLTITVRGAPHDPREPRAQARAAGPEYFAAMGIPLLRGRTFTERDRITRDGGEPQVLLISAELARRYFPNEDPIGKYLQTGWGNVGWPGVKFGGEVIGIVGDVRQRALSQDVTPHMYMPYLQWPVNEYDVVIRSTTPPDVVLAGARMLLRALDPQIPMNDARAYTDIVAGSLGDRRFYMVLLALFAAVAMSLAVVGVYGVMAYGVQQRRREIGIRMALGATRKRVVRMVLSDGLRMVGAGVALGLVAASGLTRLLHSLLYSVGPRDPVTFVVAPLLLTFAAVVACALPARKASRLDPVETIRAE
jgi:putative ABC transport system permease protein